MRKSRVNKKEQKDKQNYLLLIIDSILFVARNCTNNCLKTIIKDKSTLIKARFVKKVIFKKITIVKKKLVFSKFIKLTFAKFRKVVTFKFNIKNLANTKNSIFVNKILQVCILFSVIVESSRTLFFQFNPLSWAP